MTLFKVAHYGMVFAWIQFPTQQNTKCNFWRSIKLLGSSHFWHSSRQCIKPSAVLIFITDMLDCVRSSAVGLFADDIVLYHQITSHSDAADLQRDLDALQAWKSKWVMKFNPRKCQSLHITLKYKPVQSSYTVPGLPGARNIISGPNFLVNFGTYVLVSRGSGHKKCMFFYAHKS